MTWFIPPLYFDKFEEKVGKQKDVCPPYLADRFPKPVRFDV